MPVFTNVSLQSGYSIPCEDVVFSGISGYFPDWENAYQVQENLVNNVNVVMKGNQHWIFSQ
jgi:hypothetical protein